MPRVILVMGPCGAGKSTLGARLAEKLGARFLEADDFCPIPAKTKMAAGIPLDDSDRWPWLDRLNTVLRSATEPRWVLACSAHKEAYRGRLFAGVPDHRVVCLEGPLALLAQRMTERHGHFMPVALLPGQIALIERPAVALFLDVGQPLDALVAAAAAYAES